MLLRSRSGQSIIEYSVIAGIVILAIIYGGPFLVNSIQAHFKIMDDNAQDSFSENIKQAGKPKESQTCSCSPDSDDPGKWPQVAATCGTDGCPINQRQYGRTCTPAGCRDEKACVDDANCCGDQKKLLCGSLLAGVAGSKDYDACDSRQSLAAYPQLASGEIADSNGNLQPIKGLCSKGSNCAYNERMFTLECGKGNTVAVCIDDTQACAPKCINSEGAADEQAYKSCKEYTSEEVLQEIVWRVNGVIFPGYFVFRDVWREYRLGVSPHEGDFGNRQGAYVVPYIAVALGKCPEGRSCAKECQEGSRPSADGLSCVSACACGPENITWCAGKKKVSCSCVYSEDGIPTSDQPECSCFANRFSCEGTAQVDCGFSGDCAEPCYMEQGCEGNRTSDGGQCGNGDCDYGGVSGCNEFSRCTGGTFAQECDWTTNSSNGHLMGSPDSCYVTSAGAQQCYELLNDGSPTAMVNCTAKDCVETGGVAVEGCEARPGPMECDAGEVCVCDQPPKQNDGVCEAGENCANSPSDCYCGYWKTCNYSSGVCESSSGNGHCDISAGENCSNCQDCDCDQGWTCSAGACVNSDCGDGICDPSAGENCHNCQDCDCG